MPTPSDASIEKYKKAYVDALEEAKKCMQEAAAADLAGKTLTTTEGRNLFKKKQQKAWAATENWRKAAENLFKAAEGGPAAL